MSLAGQESVGIVEYLMDGERTAGGRRGRGGGALAARGADRGPARRARRRRPDAARTGSTWWSAQDPSAPPLWARFYEIGTNRPLFLGRDGVVRGSLAEIEPERRTHYSWLGPYAADLLDRSYPAWHAAACGAGMPMVIPKAVAAAPTPTPSP